MKLKELETYLNESIKLRSPNTEKAEQYGEAMLAGAKFPPIKVGHWPKTEKYGEQGIVDGVHRLLGAAYAKWDDFPTESIKFQTLSDALVYMVTANQEHGIPLTEGQRNKRIVLLKQMDPKLTLEKIGKLFNLHTSSVDRILKGVQGEGKSGVKTGTHASPAHKNQEPKKAVAIYKSIVALNVEFDRKRPNQLAELGSYCSPISEKHPDGEVDQDKLVQLIKLAQFLTLVIKELS